MKLKLVDETIAVCEAHLAATNSRGSQVDLYLASYLAVRIHSAFEQEIEKMVEDRANHVGDPVLRNFMMSCVDAVFRSTKISEMAGLLNRFGEKYKTEFQDQIKNQQRASASWDSIVSHRHGTAHESAGTVFVHEIVGYYNHGHLVLDAFKASLDSTRIS
jgi:hypothetical protein